MNLPFPRIPFHALKAFLESYGFEHTKDRRGQELFKYPQLGAILIFPAHTDHTNILEHIWTSVEMQLYYNGIATKKELQQFLIHYLCKQQT